MCCVGIFFATATIELFQQPSNRKEIKAGAVHMGRAGKGERGRDITKKFKEPAHNTKIDGKDRYTAPPPSLSLYH